MYGLHGLSTGSSRSRRVSAGELATINEQYNRRTSYIRYQEV